MRRLVLSVSLAAALFALPASSAVVEGKAAPEFALQDASGGTVRLADLRGDVVLVNFWATWCAPCRHEIPVLVALQEKYRSEGLRIVGISVDSPRDPRVGPFLQRMKVNYPVVFTDGAVTARYGAETLPATFLVSRDGRLLRSLSGAVAAADIEELVTSALAESAPPTAKPAR
jgi:thiol-disulfide isomerase/thioredoxin